MMKIFGFFVDQSKRLMALVIVLVLLASAVGVVSGYESGGGCIAYLDADPVSITADGKSTSIMYFKAWCPGKYRFSAVPSIGTITLEFPQIVPGRPSYATYTAPTTQELEDYKGVTITFYLKDDKDPNVIIESKSVTISLVPEEAVENCENYCKEKFDKEQPAFMRLFNSRGEYPFCICECIDERTGESVLCWGKDWDCEKYCSEMYKNKQWDGISEWPYCQCICKQGYEEREKEGCVPCNEICRRKGGKHCIEDKEKSEPNSCACKCEDGYDDSYSEKCEKVECPLNSTNVADLDSPCPKDRILNRHCCCEEGYIRYGGVCVKEKEPAPDDTGKREYSIFPALLNEIDIGEKIKFTVVKADGKEVEQDIKNKFSWSVVDSKSISDYKGAWTTIGRIDATGIFTSLNIGTCRVVLKLEGNKIDECDVKVKCPENVPGDLKKIFGLYRKHIPKGPILEELKKGKISIPWKYMDPGGATNILSWKYKKYDDFTCGGYQNKVMVFMHNQIEANPDYCTSLNGYEFLPIMGVIGFHHAVVIFPKGTDWKKTGTVLDPWPTQTPEIYPIYEWSIKFPGIGEEIFESDENKYGSKKNRIGGAVYCPVDILLTDSQGRRIGVLDNGSIVHDIPNALLTNAPDGNGENNWYFELDPDVSQSYTLRMIATDEGTFVLVTASAIDGRVEYYNYGEQLIGNGEQAHINLDANSPGAPLILPTGEEIRPTTFEPPSNTIGMTFESCSKPCGSSVQIPLTLSGIEDKIGNMDITLSYDSSVLEATEVTKGDLTSDSLFEYNIMDGTIKISLADAEGFSGNGSIAYVTFNVTGATGSSSPLQIATLAANRAEDYEVLVIPTNDGLFRVIFISTEESGGLTVSVSDTTGAKGSTVEVPINLEGATEVGSMDIVLTYDADVLSAVDVEAGALGKNALIESNTARKGEVIIALADSSGINGDGALASVAFEVIGDAGTTSYLTLEEVLVHNLDLGEIIPTTVNGTFLVI